MICQLCQQKMNFINGGSSAACDNHPTVIYYHGHWDNIITPHIAFNITYLGKKYIVRIFTDHISLYFPYKYQITQKIIRPHFTSYKQIVNFVHRIIDLQVFS